MNAGFYTHAAYLITTKQLNLASDPLSIMLVGTAEGGYQFSAAHRWVDPGVSDNTSPLYNELQATNYAGGHSGTGRESLLRTVVEDDSNSRIRFIFTNVTWPAIGGTVNDTIAAAIVYSPGSADSTSVLVAYWPLTEQATAGEDFTLIMDSVAGNMQALV